MNRAIHGPIKGLPRFDPPIEDPSPARPLFDLTVWRVMLPRDVPPTNWFVSWHTSPNRSRVQAIVEEDDNGTSPVSSHWDCVIPASWSLHPVRCEVKRINFRLGEVMSSRDGPLWSWLGESGKDFDQISLPCPRHDRSKMFAGLVRGAARILAVHLHCSLVHPIQKVSDFLPRKLFE